MALRDLSLEAMLGVSERTLNPSANRSQVHDKEELYSGLLVLRRAHDNLITINRRDGEVREQIAALTVEMTALDNEHDRCSRAIHRILSSAVDIIDDPNLVAQCQSVLDVLYPNGLTINQLSYTEQAGNTMRVMNRITPELRAFLSTIVLLGHSLEDVLDRWLAAGTRLGELQSERDMLNTDQDPNRVTPAIILDGRNQWIRAMNSFISALDATNYTDTEKTAILAHLRAAEARARRPRGDGGDAEVGEGGVSDGADVGGEVDGGVSEGGVSEGLPASAVSPVADDV